MFDCHGKDVLKVRYGFSSINVPIFSLLECQKLVKPVIKLIFCFKNDGNAIVQGIKWYHKLITRVSGVQFSVDIKAFLQHYLAFRCCLRLPLPFVIVILQLGGGGWSAATQNKPFFLIWLQFLQRGRADDWSLLHQYTRVSGGTFLLQQNTIIIFVISATTQL